MQESQKLKPRFRFRKPTIFSGMRIPHLSPGAHYIFIRIESGFPPVPGINSPEEYYRHGVEKCSLSLIFCLVLNVGDYGFTRSPLASRSSIGPRSSFSRSAWILARSPTATSTTFSG